MNLSRTVMWNAYSAAVAAGTALVAHKLVDALWTTITGDEDAPSTGDPDVPLAKAVAWAVLSGLGIGVTQLVANRIAAERWQHFTGEKKRASRPVVVNL